MTPAPIPGPGVYQNVPEAVYRAWPFPSASGLADLADENVTSPKQWRHDQDHPREQSDAMRLGSALHCALLEPKRFRAEYATVGPINPKTGKVYGKDTTALAVWLAQQGKANFLDVGETATVTGMLMAIQSCPKAMQFLTGGRAEVSLVCDWEWRPRVADKPGPSMLVKCRPDYVAGSNILVHVKTSVTVQPDIFAKSAIIGYGYDLSFAMYEKVWEALTGEKPVSMLIVVQNEAPWDVVVRPVGPRTLAAGAWLFEKGMETYYRCTQSGQWPGWDTPENLDPIDVPEWYSTQVLNPPLKGS